MFCNMCLIRIPPRFNYTEATNCNFDKKHCTGFLSDYVLCYCNFSRCAVLRVNRIERKFIVLHDVYRTDDIFPFVIVEKKNHALVIY